MTRWSGDRIWRSFSSISVRILFICDADGLDLVDLPGDQRFVRAGHDLLRQQFLLLVQLLFLWPELRDRGLEDGVDPLRI